MLTVADVMSVQPEAIAEDAPLEQAADRLARRGQPLVVVGHQGALVGVLRERALLQAPEPGLPCGALVSERPRTLDAGAPLVAVLSRGLVDPDEVVVITRRDRPVGTLSTEDLLRIAQHVLPAELRVDQLDLQPARVQVDVSLTPCAVLARLVSGGGELAVVLRGERPVAILSRDQLAWAHRVGVARVGSVVQRPTFLAHPDDSLRHVAHDLYRTRSRVLPVLDEEGQLVGLVGSDHVVGALLGGLQRLPRGAVA